MSVLDGRVALVSGGGRGLGRALAHALAEHGARVAVLARSAEEVERVAGEVGGLAVTADVGDRDSVEAAVGRVASELGPVDVLVNNAGVVWPLGRTAEVDPDEWAAAVGINLVGAFRLTRAVLPGMVERSFGRVLAISSGAASPPGMPSANAYSAAKAGLDMLVVNLAAELDGSGVTVNAVRPGVVDTPMQEYMRGLPPDQVGAAFHARFTGLHERGELVRPEDAAAFCVEVLAGDRNGQVLDVRDRR